MLLAAADMSLPSGLKLTLLNCNAPLASSGTCSRAAFAHQALLWTTEKTKEIHV